MMMQPELEIPKAPEIAAIVVNLNRRELLLEALQSLVESRGCGVRLIVVDNGSTDGSADAVARQFSDAIIVRNTKNLGFARANNQGIETAAETRAPYVFFLNNDATVDPNCLAALHNVLTGDIGAAAPFIFYHERPDLIWYGGGSVALWRGWIGHQRLRRRFDPKAMRAGPTDYLTGCALLARLDAVRAVGGFDESYSLYAEDVDLSLKLRQCGWKLWVTPAAMAYHRVSATSGGEWSPFKAYHSARSKALLFRRFATPWMYPTLAVGGLLAFKLVLLRLVLKGGVKSAGASCQGVIAGLTKRKVAEKFKI